MGQLCLSCCSPQPQQISQINYNNKDVAKGISTDINSCKRSSKGSSKSQRSKHDACILGGFVNIGNTCYMNSGLQCLFHTSLLNKKLVNYNGQFIRQFKNVFEKIQYPQPFQPKQLKRLIQNYNPQFKGKKQNDAGELITTVINLIAQETNDPKASSKEWPLIKSVQGESDEQLYEKQVIRDQSHCDSVIDKIITGRFKTKYQCSNCRKQERLFEKYNLIYLPIPKQKHIDLKNCIRQFNNPDILDSWDCGNCAKDYKHTKTMSIYKPNTILIFCLKRFSNNGRKNKAHVNIPNSLDYSQIVLGKQGPINSTYQLYGVVKHVGNLQSGHYTALCLNEIRSAADSNEVQKRWLQYNDEKVSPISDEMLKQHQRDAYIVFYRLKQETITKSRTKSITVPV